MAKINGVKEVAVAELKPFERNAKQHSEEQVELIGKSIKEFGFLNPILIDKNNNIIAGHGRVMAATKLGMSKVPAIYVEGLSEEQFRAYVLADNKLTELGEWDMEIVGEELEFLKNMDFDISLTGFDVEMSDSPQDWEEMDRRFKERMAAGEISEEDEEYQEFLKKFELKKTTDDCYTPQNIYDVVRDWAVRHYGLEGRRLIRPFYPGGDYQSEAYPKGCVVLDNPPFSILSDIVAWYTEKGIDFFLFGPALTLFSTYSGKAMYVACGATVTYENGAQVQTGFVTNLGTGKICVSNELHELIEEENKKNLEAMHKNLPKYEYPREVVTSSRCNYMAIHGQNFEIDAKDTQFIRALDAQKETDKAIFGGGFLLSEKAAAEKAAAEKAAAEKAAAEVWKLSDAELEIIKKLG